MIAGLYGNPILSFPERFETVDYYSQDPQINTGYTNKSPPQSVTGVFQNQQKGLKDANGNLVTLDNYFFWTSTNLKKGNFIDYHKEVFRITNDNAFHRTGDFFRYQLDRVIGNTGGIMITVSGNTGGDMFI